MEEPGPDGIVLTTERLRLRLWRVDEAPVLRQLWEERDPRVPPHRRPGPDGRPTVADLEGWIRKQRPGALGWLAMERRVQGDVVGHCGLLAGDRVPAGEPEIAFELLRHAWHRGLATEAAAAVVGWADRSGHRRLWATVRRWNVASLRVLARVGFEPTDRVEPDDAHGDTLFLTRPMSPPVG